jgi:hypothetical protein
MKTGIKKISQFEHIGTIMEKVMADFRKSFDHHLLEAQDVWPDVVGSLAAQNTKPAAFKGKILLVHVAGSSWMHELQFLKEEIIHGINARLGAERIREIRFKIGPI